MAAIGSPNLTWNLEHDVTNLFTYHFMINVFRAGTAVALVAAVAGWFMVLRRRVRSPGTHSSLVGFPGAAAASGWREREPLGTFLPSCISGGAADLRGFPRADGGAVSRGVGRDR